MDADFFERLQNITLTADEEIDITVNPNHHTQALEECALSLFGRFLTDKPINIRAAKSLLRSIWKFGNDLKIVEVDDGLLQFRFKLENQLNWVLDKSPWSFDNHMLVLRKWTKGMTPRNVCFTHIPLWVQVWGLPFELLNEEVAQDIRKGLGTVVDIDNTAFYSDQARFLCICVDIPLCFTCGKLGHEMKACHQKTANTGGTEHPYDDWMRAGGKRRNDEGNHRENSPPGRSQPKSGFS
ncbi:hypothetical protein SO802_029534 [Lithocarpus litseifolius]|uniref:CCHC-type domain-containing protein n=1 Tax=Lithocarpus litseifolius TaxID=425828 RepID=A0AAW2BZ27_9ROSI